MSTTKRKLIRSTKLQLAKLLEYMYSNRSFANSEYTGHVGYKLHIKEWESLQRHLNEAGPQKTLEQWRNTWRDIKKRAREEDGQVKRAHAIGAIGSQPLPELSEQSRRVLEIIGAPGAVGIEDYETGGGEVYLLPRIKRTKGSSDTKVALQSVIKIFKQSCIDLVKVHNRPLELFDDEAFRRIVGLLQFGSRDHKYKDNFSAELVQAWIDKAHEVGSDENSNNQEAELEVEVPEDSCNEVNIDRLKSERATCSCSDKGDEGDVTHDADCRLAAEQPYWEHFLVSPDDATCTICHKKLHWNNLSELKTHLQTTHPSVKYKDDDDAFAESLDAIHETEEYYIEEDALRTDADISPTPKKRKTIPTADIPKRLESVKLNDKTEIPIDRFKVLDRFGLYVSGLLASLPLDRCRKFQLDIVDKLLLEQAAAG